jgi:hypothetical protein
MIIAIDYDGSVVAHAFPAIGKDIGAIPVLKRLTNAGNKLILFTMRSNRPNKGNINDPTILDKSGMFLDDAVNWFKQNDIPLYGIQKNPSQQYWTTSPKCYAELYIDDAALGCPLKFDEAISDRPFVDWEKVERILEEMKLI